MAEYEDVGTPHGPALVFTTRYLRKGPRRISLRTYALAIPGTYQLSKVIGAGVGAIAGLILGFPVFAVTGTWLAIVALATIGAMGGIFAVSWSPLKGESVLKWFILHTAKRNSLIEQNGGFVRAYVGGAVVRRSLYREAQIVRAYVEASPVSEAVPVQVKAKSEAAPREKRQDRRKTKKGAAAPQGNQFDSVEARVRSSLPPAPPSVPTSGPSTVPAPPPPTMVPVGGGDGSV